jgi:hypothetical protein
MNLSKFHPGDGLRGNNLAEFSFLAYAMKMLSEKYPVGRLLVALLVLPLISVGRDFDCQGTVRHACR